MKPFSIVFSLVVFVYLVVSCNNSNRSLVEDVDTFFQSGKLSEMYVEIQKKYSDRPKLGNDTVGKMITEYYEKVHLDCPPAARAILYGNERLIEYPCSILQYRIKEGSFWGNMNELKISEIDGADWYTAYYWDMIYNRRVPIDSLDSRRFSKVENHLGLRASKNYLRSASLETYVIEPIKFQKLPLKWYKIYYPEPHFHEFKMHIDYVTLLDNRLSIRLSFEEKHEKPGMKMQTKESDIEKVLQTAINWEWLKTMNLINQNY